MVLKKKGPAVAAVLIVLALVIVALYIWLRPVEAPPYIETTGVIEATEVSMTSKVPGRIEWLCCVEGGTIEAGAVAVRLESQELKARLEEAKAALSGAEESINESRVSLENSASQNESAKFEAEAARAEVERLGALMQDAKQNLERAEGLFKSGYIPKKDLDSSRTAYDAGVALLQSAKSRQRGADANVRTSEVNIKAARARIATAGAKRRQASAELEVAAAQFRDTVIASPITGVIIYKSFEPGEYVNPGASIYTIDDLNNVWARVDIEETRVQDIKLGAGAEVSPSGEAQAIFKARVSEVGQTGEFATQKDVTRGRPEIKTFRVKARIEDPKGRLKPGMTVRVRIHTKAG